jgi:hypothetical protein
VPGASNGSPAQTSTDERPPSLVEPEVLEALAVVDAVDHEAKSLEMRLPADCPARQEDDGPRIVFHQPALDVPNQLLALYLIGLDRLLIDQLVDLGIGPLVAQNRITLKW